MKDYIDRHPVRTRRFFEILIPLTSWGLITMPLWLSFWHPAVVAYLVLGFDVYWLYKSFTMAFNGVKAFLTLSAHTKIDWLTDLKKIPGWEKIYHVLIIPEYGEPLSVLEDTFVNLTKQEYPIKEHLFIVLATEEKDPQAQNTFSFLQHKYRSYFKDMIMTCHPLISGEVAGKSSNMAYAGKEIVKRLEAQNINLKNTIVTSCDADVMLHPKYFAYLTHKFLLDDDREYHFYQSAIMFYANIWRIPLPGRVINTISSIMNLSLLPQDYRFINFSTYSVCLNTVKRVNYWGIDVVPEDYHLFFKTYFTLGAKVKTKPIYLPVMADAAESHGFWRTMVNQYEQQKRWAWGVSDIPYVLKNYFSDNHIPLGDKTLRVLALLENHIFWPTNWFILTLGSTIPPIVNQNFSRTILGHNLAQLSSGILTISMIFLAIMIFIDLKAKPQRPKEFKAWKIPILYLQWLTLPLVSFFLSALPGLDAHTRLMLGKRLEYRVTEKI